MSILFKILNLLALVFCFHSLYSQETLSDSEKLYNELSTLRDEIISVRLNNGDMLSGILVDIKEISDTCRYSLKIKTEIGTAEVYLSQIAEYSLLKKLYRHNHRHFILPTAEPIGDNFFIGDFEMLFLYAGFGISDFLSITAGRTIVPFIPSQHQATEFNVKWTVYSGFIEDIAQSINLAVGANYALLNDKNSMAHLYGIGSFKISKSTLTAGLFFKVSGDDLIRVEAGETYFFDMNYPSGAIGVALGLDTKFSSRSDLHLIGELWNANITQPTHTGIMLGFRLANTNFSADFGVAFFTQPLFLPVASFVWTPF